MAELKPCPFCGGVPTHWLCTANGLYVTKLPGQVLHGLKAEHNMIGCNRCGCRTRVFFHKQKAFNAWNRRYTPTEIDFDYEAEDE